MIFQGQNAIWVVSYIVHDLISNYMTPCLIYLGQEGGGNALAERLLRTSKSLTLKPTDNPLIDEQTETKSNRI